jgi:hypothetical protein
MNGEFANAKLCFRAIAAIQWLVWLIALTTACEGGANALGPALFAFVAPLAMFLLRELGSHFYGKGDRVRKILMLWQGLDRAPSEDDLLNVLASASERSRLEPLPIGGYYAPAGAPGMAQLMFQLQESAFWTSHLARIASIVNYAFSGSGLVATATIAFTALRNLQGGAGTQVDFSKVFASLLLFFAAGTNMAAARAYGALAEAAKVTLKKSSTLRREGEVDVIEAHKVLSAYDAALAKALPIPGYVYRFMQKRIQAAWDAAQPRPTG